MSPRLCTFVLCVSDVNLSNLRANKHLNLLTFKSNNPYQWCAALMFQTVITPACEDIAFYQKNFLESSESLFLLKYVYLY